MIDTIIYYSQAEDELTEIVDYYNNISDELGYDFLKKIKSSIQNICEFPELYPTISKFNRKCHCKRFPYNVIYHLHDNSIYIVAIAHEKRKPNYWKKRLN